MSQQYYYFYSTLPMLFFGAQPSMSTAAFVAQAQVLMASDEARIICDVLDPTVEEVVASNDTLKVWQTFEQQRRNAQAKYRAQRAQKDPLLFQRGEVNPWPQLTDVVGQAEKMDNLLQGEKIIDRLRWQFLEDLKQGHYYDVDALIIYGLQLQILERHQCFSSTQGEQVLADLLEKQASVSSVDNS